jgi:hypothetical protein
VADVAAPTVWALDRSMLTAQALLPEVMPVLLDFGELSRVVAGE